MRKAIAVLLIERGKEQDEQVVLEEREDQKDYLEEQEEKAKNPKNGKTKGVSESGLMQASNNHR